MEFAKTDPEITQWYYFTGGTALAHYYLHHRYSEDLDFFTQSQVNPVPLDAFFQKIRTDAQIIKVQQKKISGLFMYTLTFEDGSELKVDFNEYDFPQVERGPKDGALQIDSLYDIAINKLYTVLSRSKARDFVDLYCCLELNDFSLEQLFDRKKDKFFTQADEIEIARKFSSVADVADYPTMLVPFDRDKMIAFFLSEAKKYGNRIFK